MPDNGGIRLLGLDPGLQATGWGVVESRGTHLRHVADGTIRTQRQSDMGARLTSLGQ